MYSLVRTISDIAKSTLPVDSGLICEKERHVVHPNGSASWRGPREQQAASCGLTLGEQPSTHSYKLRRWNVKTRSKSAVYSSSMIGICWELCMCARVCVCFCRQNFLFFPRFETHQGAEQSTISSRHCWKQADEALFIRDKINLAPTDWRLLLSLLSRSLWRWGRHHTGVTLQECAWHREIIDY